MATGKATQIQTEGVIEELKLDERFPLMLLEGQWFKQSAKFYKGPEFKALKPGQRVFVWHNGQENDYHEIWAARVEVVPKKEPEKPSNGHGGRNDDRTDARTALMQAVALYPVERTGTEISDENLTALVTACADKFADWLAFRANGAKRSEAEPEDDFANE